MSDSIKPRVKLTAAPKGAQFGKRFDEGILHDVFGVRRIAKNLCHGVEQSILILPDQTLERRQLTRQRLANQAIVFLSIRGWVHASDAVAADSFPLF